MHLKELFYVGVRSRQMRMGCDPGLWWQFETWIRGSLDAEEDVVSRIRPPEVSSHIGSNATTTRIINLYCTSLDFEFNTITPKLPGSCLVSSLMDWNDCRTSKSRRFSRWSLEKSPSSVRLAIRGLCAQAVFLVILQPYGSWESGRSLVDIPLWWLWRFVGPSIVVVVHSRRGMAPPSSKSFHLSR